MPTIAPPPNFKEDSFYSAFFSKLFESLQSLITYTFKRDQKDIENIEREKRIREADPKAGGGQIETFKSEASLVANLWDLMITILRIHPSCSEILLKSNRLENILQKGYLKSDNERLKHELSNGLLEIMRDKHNFSEKLIQQVFPTLIKGVLPQAMLANELRSDSFFMFLKNFLKDANLEKLKAQGLFSPKEFLDYLSKFVMEREPVEQQNKDFDIPLWGSIELMEVLLPKNPEKKFHYGQVIFL